MEDNTNIQNTAGEAGSNVINMDELATKLAEVMAQQAPKTQKKAVERLANNVINGFDGLNDDLKTQLYNDYLTNETKRKNAEVEKYAKMEKELAKANEKIKLFEAEKLQSAIKQNSINVLNELEIKEQKDIALVQDLAGDRLYACVKEDGSFDKEAAKTLFEDITNKYELSFKKQVNTDIHMGGAKQEPKAKKDTTMDEYKRILGILK